MATVWANEMLLPVLQINETIVEWCLYRFRAVSRMSVDVKKTRSD